MNNTIRIIRTEYATDINQNFATDIDQDLASVGVKHKPYLLNRTSMNKILVNTSDWKHKFKPEYHAKTT